jgi:invasion protein IalB
MLDLTKSLALIATLGLAGGAYAQDTTAPATTEAPAAEAPAVVEGDAATGDNLSLGAPVAEEGGVGSTYISGTHGDWEVRCVKTAEGIDPCQLYQLLKDQGGNSVAEISMFNLPEGERAAAGATIVTPLETLLTQQIRLQIDAGTLKTYPFTWCAPIGCIARVGFTAEEVGQFKNGKAAVITIVPVAAPDQKVELTVSLAGFTAGYKAVTESNAKLPAPTEPAPTNP